MTQDDKANSAARLCSACLVSWQERAVFDHLALIQTRLVVQRRLSDGSQPPNVRSAWERLLHCLDEPVGITAVDLRGSAYDLGSAPRPEDCIVEQGTPPRHLAGPQPQRPS